MWCLYTACKCFNVLWAKYNTEGLLTYFADLDFSGKTYDSIAMCRLALYTGSRKPMESIPPSSDALLLHFKRTAYWVQTWRQMMSPMQKLPSPSEWGYSMSNAGWVAVRRTLPLATEACAVVSCSCQVKCTGNCACHKENKQNLCIPDMCKCICFK